MGEDNIRIGRLLQTAREQHRVSQAALCDTTGLSKNHISAVERGVSKASVKMLLGYCEKLNVTPNDILGYGETLIFSFSHNMSGANASYLRKQMLHSGMKCSCFI